MKKYNIKKLFFQTVLLFITFLTACGGGGGGSHNYSGTWKLQGTLSDNNCNINMARGINYDISVTHTGEDIIFTDGSNTFIGKTTWVDYEEIHNGFGGEYISSNGLRDVIYVMNVKGGSGYYVEYVYIPDSPVASNSGSYQSCVIRYEGEAKKLN